ncbi:PTS sugar transporter subunit IIC [Spiractinospora alimapuensis]|uniref:PTS transporter subunit IIC n=1 Tax=Spiractinospora alimapuensis TaxID=2820884 RepID=UPI001F3C96D0|nr:PTS sugar transporter subunit IIC [Spiractinospora alimapuensis]QVQ54516.1 PTS sugar transporter subunit IIC [Spiractinospora alimapuensis]
MKTFLANKGVRPSLHTYFIEAMSFMALGLFSSLLIGLIIQTVGEQAGVGFLIEAGTLAMGMMGPAIGVAVAYALGGPPLVLFSAAATGAAGAELGGPAGAFLAAVVSVEIGKIVSKETKIDIVVTPAVTVLSGFAVAWAIGPVIDSGLRRFGELINWATTQEPFTMSILIAVLMGLALTAPISSAAIAVMLDLSGLAAGAATVGCSAQMVGFAVMSFRENRWGGLASIGLGTSMLQFPNILKNPRLLIPPTLAGAILAPIAVIVFSMESNAAGAGMGTAGFVGQIMTITTMGFSYQLLAVIVAFHIVLPALIAWVISLGLRKISWIKDGDQLIRQG